MKNKDLPLWLLVNGLLREYAGKFGLTLRDIRPIKRKHHGKYVASCSQRGRIRIDLRNRFGKRFDAYHLIDTIAHELAHLRYQNHSASWFELHMQILDLMRVSGVYLTLRRALKKKYSVI